ncbi:MAG: hypothetical protein WBO73_16220 [Gammaproteobacteria bacterium]|jgi:hypothetical protein
MEAEIFNSTRKPGVLFSDVFHLLPVIIGWTVYRARKGYQQVQGRKSASGPGDDEHE